MKTLTHRFVEFIPEQLEKDTVYVSMEYATVVHLCCCGCGSEVVTPLSPTDWKLTYNGEAISLNPSIGNWGFNCRSHYWIKKNKVEWSDTWTDNKVQRGREKDIQEKSDFYKRKAAIGDEEINQKMSPKKRWFIWRLLFGERK